MFDISQTDGEPLPDLDTEATGDAGDLVGQLTDASDELGVTVQIIPTDEWTHGEAKGICEQLSLVDMQPRVEIRDRDRDRENDADLARTLIHEYAHALLHFDVDDDTERSKREVRPKPSRTSLGGTADSIPAARRSTSQSGSRTIPRLFASGLDGSVRRRRKSSTHSKRESNS